MNLLRLFFVSAALTLATVPTLVRAAEPVASLAPAQALEALQQLLAAYATGNPKQLEALVEPQMIGYSRVVDPVRDAGVAQRQLRLTLSDTQTRVAQDVVIVQTRWDKRYLPASGRGVVNTTGHCTFIMRPLDAAVWKLSALSGDNPFSPG